MQHGRPGQGHAHLLLKLARQRLLQRLAPFDPAAGEEPARPVAVPHQEHAILRVDDDPLRTERHAPAQTPEGP
ncbi:hypothetical protein AUC69_06730 [Methyloceanibacter superfactus]|uniref:Uncharacterized protein n=1 Tax=Methyloceanibacter superfactus TaxID=1774969 RepID=A0A1E3W6H6_9HYPH|nr:hypothetical protein AUC69_06730 [Methyloceanibacter superfactus]